MRPPLERIMEGKSRRLTFQRRWLGLQKKAQELSILCGVDTCLIIFAASSDDRPSKPLFWPPKPEHVRAIVRRYKEHGKGKRLKTKTLNSSKKGVSSKLGTEEMEFPTFLDERFDGLSVGQSKRLLKFGEAKLVKVRSMIDQLRKMGQEGGPATQNPSFTDTPTPALTQVLEVPHLSAAVDCSSTEPNFFRGFSGRNTPCSPPSPQPQFLYDPDAVLPSMLLSPLPPPLQFFHEPSSSALPQDQFFYEQPCSGMSVNIDILCSNNDKVSSSSTSSSLPAMPPYDYYGYPAHYMVAAPIQSLPPQVNTVGNETWEQYLRFD